MTISQLKQHSEDSLTTYPVQLVTIDLGTGSTGLLRLTTSSKDIEYDTLTYSNAHNVLSLSAIEETQEIRSSALDIRLSGLNSSIIAALNNINAIGGTVTVLQGFVNNQGDLQNDFAYLKWQGIINSVSTDEENTDIGDINITIECKSKVGAILNTAGGRNTSHPSFVNDQAVSVGALLFRTTSTYELNDLVRFRNKIYQSNGTISAGPFDESEWTDITDYSMEFVASMVQYNPSFGKEE